MTTLITRFEQTKPKQATLRIEGSLLLVHAQTIEDHCLDLRRRGIHITINLARIGFLTNGAAEILYRLRRQFGVVLEGTQFVAREIVDSSEMSLKNARI